MRPVAIKTKKPSNPRGSGALPLPLSAKATGVRNPGTVPKPKAVIPVRKANKKAILASFISCTPYSPVGWMDRCFKRPFSPTQAVPPSVLHQPYTRKQVYGKKGIDHRVGHCQPLRRPAYGGHNNTRAC